MVVAHDVGSYRVLLQLAQTSIVEMHMVITSWSLARLEQQLESVMACLGYLSLMLGCGSHIAGHDIILKLQCLANADPSCHGTSEAETEREAPVAQNGTAHDGLIAIKAEAVGTDPKEVIGCSEVAPFARSIVGTSALKALEGPFVCLTSSVQTCMGDLISRAAEAKALSEKLVSRLGNQLAGAMADNVVDFHSLQQCVQSNKEMLDAFCEYVLHASRLIAKQPLGLDQVLLSTCEDGYMAELSKFCCGHQSFGSTIQLEIALPQDITGLSDICTFTKTATSFKTEFGDVCFETHASPALDTCVATLQSTPHRHPLQTQRCCREVW